ncbi:hypothetical protein QFC20_006719, partial [Naganishia adeliensis]
VISSAFCQNSEYMELNSFMVKQCVKLCKNGFEPKQDNAERLSEFAAHMKGFDQDSILFFNSLKESDVRAGRLHFSASSHHLVAYSRTMCLLAKYTIGALAVHFHYH